jgi:hypothetical protein
VLSTQIKAALCTYEAPTLCSVVHTKEGGSEHTTNVAIICFPGNLATQLASNIVMIPLGHKRTKQNEKLLDEKAQDFFQLTQICVHLMKADSFREACGSVIHAKTTKPGTLMENASLFPHNTIVSIFIMSQFIFHCVVPIFLT